MMPETFSYTLTLARQYAGTQEWVIRPDKGTVVVRVQTEFGGALAAGRKVQESRLQPVSGFSLAYAEADGSSRKPGYETVFDERSGLVTLRQGKDEASLPLLESHHDPLSLLLWLRRPPVAGPGTVPAGQPPDSGLPDARPSTVRLVGGRVHLQSLPDSEVSGMPAWVYFLRPGGAYVYVEQQAPHRLLRLIQPSDFGPVEALLAQGALPRDAVRTGHRHEQAHPVRGRIGKPRRRSR